MKMPIPWPCMATHVLFSKEYSASEHRLTRTLSQILEISNAIQRHFLICQKQVDAFETKRPRLKEVENGDITELITDFECLSRRPGVEVGGFVPALASSNHMFCSQSLSSDHQGYPTPHKQYQHSSSNTLHFRSLPYLTLFFLLTSWESLSAFICTSCTDFFIHKLPSGSQSLDLLLLFLQAELDFDFDIDGSRYHAWYALQEILRFLRQPLVT